MASKGLFHKRAFFLELVFVGLHLIQAQGQSGALQGGPNQENITIFSFQESIVFCSFLLVYVAFDSRKRDVLQATEQSVSPTILKCRRSWIMVSFYACRPMLFKSKLQFTEP